METYVALLRGINVSGHRKLPMADLRALMHELGYGEVTTYIQSGNVVFKGEAAKDHASVISEKIRTAYGWEVPVMVFTREVLSEIFMANPFPEDLQKKTYFTLLYPAPLEALVKQTAAVEVPGETFHITPRCVYFYPELGAGKAKLSNNWFESKLKVTATSRNYNTLQKLLDMMD